MTIRDQLEQILSQYAAMRIHQQVAIDQILEVTKPPASQFDSPEWVKNGYAAYTCGG